MTRQAFHRDASILLVGGRGTGKSSLAMILWSSLHFKHIEFDDFFRKATGLNRSAFKDQHGIDASREKEHAVLKEVLSNSKNCVIVYPGGLMNDSCLALVRSFANEHPVIHVRRSVTAVQRYLRQWDLAQVSRAQELTDSVFRSCANYEFYNLDEAELFGFSTPTNDMNTLCLDYPEQRPQSLRLKRMEESFKRLVKDALFTVSRSESSLRKLPPPPPSAAHSYVLVLEVSEVNEEQFSIQTLDCGADACQLDISPISTSQNSSFTGALENASRAFSILTRFFNGPIVYHVQRCPPPYTPEDVTRYIELIRQGLRLGADYLTIDLDVPIDNLYEFFAAHEISKLIGNCYINTTGDEGWTSQRRWAIYHRARALGLCGVRITQPATNVADNHAVVGFVAEVNRIYGHRPFLIAYNTGSLGRLSRCHNQILTPIASLDSKDLPAKPKDTSNLGVTLTIQACQQALYSSFVYDAMKFYIIGLDVSYSLSPDIHNAAHQFFGMPHRLSRKSLSSLDQLSELINDVHFGGLTIAQGYKTAIIPHLAAASTDARNIGAVNTVIPIRAAFDYTKTPPSEFWASRNRAGPIIGLYGDNMDWIGLTRCVLQNLSPANVITQKTVALVIGAGGMARAALYALLKMGVSHIVVHNRTISHANELADHFTKLKLTEDSHRPCSDGGNAAEDHARPDIRIISTTKAMWFDDLAQPTIVVCCVPASGIGDEPGAKFELPFQWMKSSTGGVVLDLNYQPLLTPLLRQVRQQSHRGWVWVHGLENLTTQASAQFQIFSGRKVPQNLMRTVALKSYLESHGQDPEVRDLIASSGYWIR